MDDAKIEENYILIHDLIDTSWYEFMDGGLEPKEMLYMIETLNMITNSIMEEHQESYE